MNAADDRLGPVIAVITSLAAGDLRPAFPTIEGDPDLQAIILGLQMLAEELEASRAEVQRRTEDQQIMRDGLAQLASLSNLLLACDASGEAYAVLGRAAHKMYGGLSGAVYLFGASRNVVELVTNWGDLAVARTFPPADCWALRRGRAHYASVSGSEPVCRHTGDGGGAMSALCIPMLALGETLGVLHLVGAAGLGESAFTPMAQQLAVSAAEVCALALSSIRTREKLADQSLRDPLTGLYNRRYADETLRREIARAARDSAPLGLLMIDLDHFKRFNDEFGHDAGDTALIQAATILAETVRTSDVLSRVGGEEFLLILPNASLEDAVKKGDSLRAKVKGLEVVHRGRRLPTITFSAGAAAYPASGMTPEALLRSADAALYDAKHAGRDRTFPPIGVTEALKSR